MKLTKGIKFEDDPQYKKVEDERIELKADREKTQTDKGLDDLLFGSGAVRRKPREPAVQQPQAPVNKPLPPVEEKKVVQKKETVTVQPEPKVVKPAPTTTTVVEPRVENPGRQGYNRPAYIRKLKKIAENFDFQEINQKNHTYYEIVRPFECDRSRVQVLQKLNAGGDSFNDKEFPANSFSIGKRYWKQPTEWKRASELCNRASFGKYVEPNDIELGKMTCPSFASVLSCLAQRERNIKRLLESQTYNPNGFYYVRLNINSVWRYIAVDDFLPLIEGDNVGLLSFRDNESQISLSLIEKAYAKAYAGYDVFERNCKPEHYLRDLTGARVAKYGFNDSSLMDNVQFSLDQNWTVVAVPNKSIEDLGLNSKFNLSVVGLGSRGFEIRNSWGTTTQRSKVNFSKEGIFELTLQQASRYFDHILVAETDDRQHTTTVQSKHHSGFYSSYTFRIKSTVEATISASQWDHRLFPSENGYGYSPFRLVVDRTGSGSEPEYVAGGFSFQERNLDVLVQLGPGEYTVSCVGAWSSTAYDYSLTFYTNHPLNPKKTQTEIFPNTIMSSLQAQNLKSGKRSAKGHVDQYILYHEPTNLILLTNLNVSDKPYDYVQDLSKINWGSLTLLNAPSHGEHFGGLVESEVETVKGAHNGDRRWTVHLEPKEAYTWVIGTREPFSLNNFKNWGFK